MGKKKGKKQPTAGGGDAAGPSTPPVQAEVMPQLGQGAAPEAMDEKKRGKGTPKQAAEQTPQGSQPQLGPDPRQQGPQQYPQGGGHGGRQQYAQGGGQEDPQQYPQRGGREGAQPYPQLGGRGGPQQYPQRGGREGPQQYPQGGGQGGPQRGGRGGPRFQQGSHGPPQQAAWTRPQQTSGVLSDASPAVASEQTPHVSPPRSMPTPSTPPPSMPTPSTPPPTMISIKKGLGDMSVSSSGSPSKAGGKSLGLTIPHRKSPNSCGTKGRHTVIETNYLALDLSKMVPQVYHYDVSIDPDKPKRLMRPVMEEFRKLHYPSMCAPFDGRRNLYVANRLLPFGTSKSCELKVHDPERDYIKDYKVTVKHVNTIDMNAINAFMQGRGGAAAPLAIQALDIVLRSASAARLTSVGRSFFTKPTGRVMDLGDGMECWLGFFQSAIIGWKPFVNIDVAHKGFPKEQNCVDLIAELFRADTRIELNNYNKDEFMKYIRELKVNYEIPGQPNTRRTYRVNGIAQCANKQSFTLDDGKALTVQQYYELFKKYRLQFPMMPCLDVGSPNREKKILIPCELCTLVGGQVVIKKMNEKQTTNLIKLAATNTDDRRRKIMDAIHRVNFAQDPCLREFGLRVNDKFESVKARVLDPPELKYLDNIPVVPDKGVWRSKQFLEAKSLTKWTILGMHRNIREDSLRNFVNLLRRQAGPMGMNIDAPSEPLYNIILPHEKAKLEDFLGRNKDKQLIFVVVQDQGDSYAKVKQAAENSVGVLTQCLKMRTLERMNPATCGNILLKVNAKLNGVNHMFASKFRPPCLEVPCMIVGADVTHPPPDQTNRPSVAAVCASHDPKAFKYNMQYRLQPARMEIIEDLEAIMKSHLQFFHKETKQKPKRIIFYRDGVSEGQFQEVLNKEFQAIRRACASLNENYKPAITFLVVQKRHHTRFFPLSQQDCDGRNKNVPAGTIVDTVITHPTDLDFFLVSHASIQGVSRPTKYRRLWDDSDMSEDELEQLTYYLCHMFTRCTRSVSYPAPTYYAHLAAYRAGCYLQDGQRIAMGDLANEQKQRTIKPEIIQHNPMFFV